MDDRTFLAIAGAGVAVFFWLRSQKAPAKETAGSPAAPVQPGATARSIGDLRDGMFVRGSTRTIYLIERGFKRSIPDWSTYLTIGGRQDMQNVYGVADNELARLPNGAPIPSVLLEEGAFLRGSSRTIYAVRSGRRRAIPDWDTFLSLGGTADMRAVRVVGDDELARVPGGPAMPRVGGVVYRVW